VANEFLAAEKWESYGGFNKIKDIVEEVFQYGENNKQ
jgi:hypothetical protein